jgi:hypothetical protein
VSRVQVDRDALRRGSSGRPVVHRPSQCSAKVLARGFLEYGSIKRSQSIAQDHHTQPITLLRPTCTRLIAPRCKRWPPSHSVHENSARRRRRLAPDWPGLHRGGCYADHDPACGRRSDYDLREQLRWHARTQLTVLLAPPTVLTPAQDIWDGFKNFLMVLMERGGRNENDIKIYANEDWCMALDSGVLTIELHDRRGTDADSARRASVGRGPFIPFQTQVTAFHG